MNSVARPLAGRTLRRRSFLSLLAILSVVFGLSVVSAPVASAYPQIPCTTFGTGIDYKGIKIQEGTFCAAGKKKGLTISTLSYHWDYVPQGICNWWVDFDLTNTNGARLRHSQGNTVHGCKVSFDGNRKGEALPWTAEAGGQLCATLWKSGSGNPVKVSRVCQAM